MKKGLCVFVLIVACIGCSQVKKDKEGCGCGCSTAEYEKSDDASSNAFNLPKEPFIFVRHGTTHWHVGMLAEGPKNYSLSWQSL